MIQTARNRVLVTGGAGFIGSHLCQRLVGEDWSVVAVDDLSTGREGNVASIEGDERFSLHHGDVTRDPLPPGPFDVVFHLACPASPVAYTRWPVETLEASSTGTRRCLDLARENGAIFVLASTSEVYGDPTVHPQPESYWGNVDPVGPRSMYDEGKRFAEALSSWFARTRDLDVRIARIFNTYGPRMSLRDGRAVPTFIRLALSGEPLTVHGTGNQSRSLCYVADLVEGLVLMATVESGEVNRSPINLGSPNELPILDVARLILELTGSDSSVEFVDRPPGDPERRCPDITRAATVLGWHPEVDFDQGLRVTIEWARSQVGVLG